MSDYTVTHSLQEQQERAQAEADLANWLDSLGIPEPSPQCGMCKHFKFRDLVGDDGSGWCQLRTVPSYDGGADTKEDRDMSDKVCPKFVSGTPF